MNSLIRSTMNTRALPVGSLRFIRSDVPLRLTEEEIQWLISNRITTLVDLRSQEELLQKPCCLACRDEFLYLPLPVTGGGDPPASREELYATYSRMVDSQMEKILTTIFGAKTNVMYFCTAGKDRTGVVSALILRRLGYNDETIIRDYMLSRENLMDMLTAYANQHPEVELDIIVPKKENMERFLCWLSRSPAKQDIVKQ